MKGQRAGEWAALIFMFVLIALFVFVIMGVIPEQEDIFCMEQGYEESPFFDYVDEEHFLICMKEGEEPKYFSRDEYKDKSKRNKDLIEKKLQEARDWSED